MLSKIRTVKEEVKRTKYSKLIICPYMPNYMHGFCGLPEPARPGYSPLLLWFSSLWHPWQQDKRSCYKSAEQHLQEVWTCPENQLAQCLKFRSFCDQLDIINITSSPYYNQRVVGTIKEILNGKSTGDTDITKAPTIFLHSLAGDTLPSPAELFFNRRINTSLIMIMTPVPLTNQHKTPVASVQHIWRYQSRNSNI